MLSWCCGMVESFVICGCYKYTLLASTKFNLIVPCSVFIGYDISIVSAGAICLFLCHVLLHIFDKTI